MCAEGFSLKLGSWSQRPPSWSAARASPATRGRACSLTTSRLLPRHVFDDERGAPSSTGETRGARVAPREVERVSANPGPTVRPSVAGNVVQPLAPDHRCRRCSQRRHHGDCSPAARDHGRQRRGGHHHCHHRADDHDDDDSSNDDRAPTTVASNTTAPSTTAATTTAATTTAPTTTAPTTAPTITVAPSTTACKGPPKGHCK